MGAMNDFVDTKCRSQINQSLKQNYFGFGFYVRKSENLIFMTLASSMQTVTSYQLRSPEFSQKVLSHLSQFDFPGYKLPLKLSSRVCEVLYINVITHAYSFSPPRISTSQSSQFRIFGKRYFW